MALQQLFYSNLRNQYSLTTLIFSFIRRSDVSLSFGQIHHDRLVAPLERYDSFLRCCSVLPRHGCRIWSEIRLSLIIHNSALPSLLPITLPASRPRSSSLLSPDTLLGCFPILRFPVLAQTPKHQVRPQSVSGGWYRGRGRVRGACSTSRRGKQKLQMEGEVLLRI